MEKTSIFFHTTDSESKRSLSYQNETKGLIFLRLCLYILFSSIGLAFCIDEHHIKNRSYYIKSINKEVKLTEGTGFLVEKQSGGEDTIKVHLSDFIIAKLNEDTVPDAFVSLIIRKNNHKNIICEVSAIISPNNAQTNPIIIDSTITTRGFVISYDEMNMFIEIHALSAEKDKYFYPICFQVRDSLLVGVGCSMPVIVKKPAIYLYPIKEQEIRVKIQPKANNVIKHCIPPCGDELKLTVTPEGKINRVLDYLYYEFHISEKVLLEDAGWIVRYDSLSSWFDSVLILFGLNSKEIKDFKEYWLSHLPPYPYYIIKPMPTSLIDKYIDVSISPQPDKFIRVFLWFQGTYAFRQLDIPSIPATERTGYIAVEWGGVLEEPNEFSFLPTEVGKAVLREATVSNHTLQIRVNSNGCTTKESIQPYVQEKMDASGIRHYEVTFVRVSPDYCRAYIPEGVLLEYNAVKDLKIDKKYPYFISLRNPIYPMMTNEPYFILSAVKYTIDYRDSTLRKELLEATKSAIQMEIKRYKDSHLSDKQAKIDSLQVLLKRYNQMSPQDYPLPTSEDTSTEGILGQRYGPIMPPLIEEVEILPDQLKEVQQGRILPIRGMTKSGPFYHIAGVHKDISASKCRDICKLRIYIIYKREYFGFIRNYYVYVAPL